LAIVIDCVLYRVISEEFIMFSKRNSIFGLIILCGLLFSLSFPSIAATHYVSINGGSDSPYTNGWASAATNIQWALDVATNGEAVLVTNGTYNLADQIVITNGVILQSVNGKDFTFISGQYTTFRCILLSNDNAIVDGFTVTNGKTTANGGGVYIYGGTLRNCHVRNNNSGGNGAVIARFLGTVLTTRNVFNCIITSNSGKYAGGICLQGATASNCVVSYNSSSDRQNASPGGASLESLGYLYDSEISYNNGEVGGVKIAATAGMTGCKVVGNRGYTYGGVAYLYVSANLRNCLVINNHSLSNAGGVYIQPDAAALGIQNLTVVSNSTVLPLTLFLYITQSLILMFPAGLTAIFIIPPTAVILLFGIVVLV